MAFCQVTFIGVISANLCINQDPVQYIVQAGCQSLGLYPVGKGLRAKLFQYLTGIRQIKIRTVNCQKAVPVQLLIVIGGIQNSPAVMKQFLEGFPLDFLACLTKSGGTIGIDRASSFP